MNLQDKLQSFLSTPREVLNNKNDKVLFVDGTNNYIRAFAATPTMNDDGDHWGGFTGFLKSIGMMIRDYKPSRVVLVFDGKGGSQRRRSMHANYKSNRRSMQKLNRTYNFNTIDEEVESRQLQLQELIATTHHLPVTVIALENVEADDVLAYLANLNTERGGKSIIVSTDKDFIQLVGESVKIYNPIRKKMYDADKVVEEFGIHPTNFLMFRVITGDKSDNIAGIKGIAAKTLTKNFPFLREAVKITLDDVYKVAVESTNKACNKIVNNKEQLEKNIELMRLDEPQMSGHARAKAIDAFDRPINALNKVALISRLVSLKLIGSFGDVEQWIQNTFVPLSRFSNKE